jgi:hypothetical protein
MGLKVHSKGKKVIESSEEEKLWYNHKAQLNDMTYY